MSPIPLFVFEERHFAAKLFALLHLLHDLPNAGQLFLPLICRRPQYRHSRSLSPPPVSVLELALKLTSPDEGVSFALIALNFDFVASAALQTSMHLSYVRSEIWRSFLRTLLSVIPQTILSRIISSFNTPKLHELAKSLRTVAYASMDSSEFLALLLNLYLS